MSHRNARLTVHGRRILVERVLAGRPVAHVAAEMGISRAAGTCPLWNVYEAFAAPGRIHVQIAEMPVGQRYLWTGARSPGTAAAGVNPARPSPSA